MIIVGPISHNHELNIFWEILFSYEVSAVSHSISYLKKNLLLIFLIILDILKIENVHFLIRFQAFCLRTVGGGQHYFFPFSFFLSFFFFFFFLALIVQPNDFNFKPHLQ